MSGNAFKDSDGNSLSSTICLANIRPTIEDFLVNYLKPAGVHEFKLIGSTGKKDFSGDIDILIDLHGINQKVFKDALADQLIYNMPFGHVKTIGSIISVLFPISGSAIGRMVQIDIMMADNIEDAAWLMSGTSSGVRGAFRNTLLAYLANKASELLPPRQKMTISFPGGLQLKELPKDLDPSAKKNKRKFVGLGNRITDPQKILDCLKVKASPDDASRFEDLVDIINSDNVLKNILPGFQKYAEAARFDKKGIDLAINYINNTI